MFSIHSVHNMHTPLKQANKYSVQNYFHSHATQLEKVHGPIPIPYKGGGGKGRGGSALETGNQAIHWYSLHSILAVEWRLRMRLHITLAPPSLLGFNVQPRYPG